MTAKDKNSFRRLNFAGAIHPSILQLLVIDIVCPYMIYPLLLPRIATPVALLLVALFPLASVIFGSVRRNQPDPLGIVSLYVIAAILLSNYTLFSLAVALRCALFIGIASLFTLATQLLRRPLATYVERYVQTLITAQPEAEPESESAAEPIQEQDQTRYQQSMRVINGVWGGGQLVIALILAGGMLSTAVQNFSTLFVSILITASYLILVLWTIQYWERQKKSIYL